MDLVKDNGKKMPGCVCAEGLYLLNGDCVESSKCFETGWTDFGAWSECDHECPDKNGKRSRNRFHRESGEIIVEEETCNNNLDCKLNSNFVLFFLICFVQADGPNGDFGVSVIMSAPLIVENSPECAFTNLLLISRQRNKFARIILNVS